LNHFLLICLLIFSIKKAVRPMVKIVEIKTITKTLNKLFSKYERCITTPTPIGTNKSDR